MEIERERENFNSNSSERGEESNISDEEPELVFMDSDTKNYCLYYSISPLKSHEMDEYKNGLEEFYHRESKAMETIRNLLGIKKRRLQDSFNLAIKKDFEQEFPFLTFYHNESVINNK